MSLKDIIGHERAIHILRGTLNRSRISSAYLFAGESGIGKKFTAVNFAKTLNCLKAGIRDEGLGIGGKEDSNPNPRVDCCDECPSCRKIDNRTHPDFLIISPEKGEIRVDEIRAIEEALSYAPYEGNMKIIIVDDADKMNASAANAFLKTLEEPPKHSLLILISASPDRLPETIRSRCSRINFSPLSPEKCERVLRKTLEFQTSRAHELSLIARLSMGRPGLATYNDLIEERDWFMSLLGAMLNSGAKETWADKEEIEKWLNNAITVMRDAAVLKITGKADMLINADIKDLISKISKTVEIKDIIKSYMNIAELKSYLGFNLNRSITWNYISTILKGLGYRCQR